MNQPKSLRELVELAIQHRDASGLGLSQLAAKNGLKLTATTINAIRQGTYKYTPKDETIRAIAWLAGVDDSVAFTAAGQPVPGPPFAEELPPGVDNLPPKARKAAIDMLRVLVDLNQDADEERQAELAAMRKQRDDLLKDAGYTRAQQKTEEPDDEATLAAKRAAGDKIQEYKARDKTEGEDAGAEPKSRGRKSLPIPTYPLTSESDGNIPLPEDYLDLAADTSHTRHMDREREWAHRGEETQEAE